MPLYRLIPVKPVSQEASEPAPVKTINVTDEVWKFLPEEGVLVSNLGFVLHVSERGSKVTPGFWDQRHSRYLIRNQHDKIKKTRRVARLVAEAFLPPPPNKDSVLMHLDEDASNNRKENLAWGSAQQNLNAPLYRQYLRERRVLLQKNKRVLSLEKLQQGIQELNKKHPLEPSSVKGDG